MIPVSLKAENIVVGLKVRERIESIAFKNSILLNSEQPLRVAASTASK